MKKLQRKTFFLSIISLCGLICLSSCGNDMNMFKEQAIIKDKGNRKYESKIETFIKTNNDRPVGNVYLRTNSGYKSLVSGATIQVNNLYSSSTSLLGQIFYTDEYSHKYFDAYGNVNEYLKNVNLNDRNAKHYTAFAAEDSPFYKQYSNLTSKDKTIHIFECVELRGNYNNTFYMYKEKGDTYYNFKNKVDYLSDFNGVIEGQISNFEADGKDKYIFKDEDNYDYSLIYEKDNKQNVSFHKTYENDPEIHDDEYETLFELELKDAGTYKYLVKLAKPFSNDFDFVYKDQFVDAKIMLDYKYEDHPKYVPVNFILSDDKTSALLLVKKIKDDGVLSNKWYSTIIDISKINGKLEKDVSLFGDTVKFRLGNKDLTLRDDQKLLLADKNVALTKDKNGYEILTVNNFTSIPSNVDFPVEYISYGILDNHIYFLLRDLNTSYNTIFSYDIFTLRKSTINAIEIYNINNCIYRTIHHDLMVGDKIVLNNFEGNKINLNYVLNGKLKDVYYFESDTEAALIEINEIDK